MRQAIHRVFWLLLPLLMYTPTRASAAETASATTAPARPMSWAEIVRAASQDPALSSAVDALVKQAREGAVAGILRRPYSFKEIIKNRGMLDSRTKAISDLKIRETFALSMCDSGMCISLAGILPTVAAAAVVTGDARFKQHVVDQLEEMATWKPLMRPGWTCHDGKPLPPGGNDGTWLGTGTGIRAIATTLEIMGDRVDAGLRQRLTSLLEREIASIVDDWKTKRQWFVRSNNAISNQWVLPTEGLVRACLSVGVEKHREAYELGVANLLKALSVHGQEGVFEEGIAYSMMTLQSFLHAAYAMAAAGDRRAIDHPYLQQFPTWAVMHFQPGRMIVNCFDGGGSIADRSNGGWRSFLCLMAFCGQSSVANWAMFDQFDGPSDDLVGLAYRISCRQLQRQPAPLFAAYDRGTMVVWRDRWKDDASGVWIRGGHHLDQHDHRDRGHVNFIRNGKPILIEAGTSSYGDPDFSLLYASPLGHNTMQVGTFEPPKGTRIKKGTVYKGWQQWRCVAPITVHRLDGDGGSVTVNGSKCIPECQRWLRRVDWSKTELTVRDQVQLPSDKPNVVRLLWHLSTDQPVEIVNDGARARVKWNDAALEFEANAPITLRQYSRPDATVKADHKHTCLELQSAQPAAVFNCSMHVR